MEGGGEGPGLKVVEDKEMVFQSLLTTVSTTGGGPTVRSVMGGHGDGGGGGVKGVVCNKEGSVSALRTFDAIGVGQVSRQDSGVEGVSGHGKARAGGYSGEGGAAPQQRALREWETSERGGGGGGGEAGDGEEWVMGTYVESLSRWLTTDDSTCSRAVQRTNSSSDGPSSPQKDGVEGLIKGAERRCFDWQSEEEIRPVWAAQSNYGTFTRTFIGGLSQPAFAKSCKATAEQGSRGSSSSSSKAERKGGGGGAEKRGEGGGVPSQFVEHMLLRSDTLASLAVRYGTSVEEICFANGVYGSKHTQLLVRKTIKIPTAASASCGTAHAAASSSSTTPSR